MRELTLRYEPMFKSISAYLQYLYPKHLISSGAGKLAESGNLRLKNFLIDRFIRAYNVDMSTALIEDPHQYETFNDFFTRKLKPNIRPIAPTPEIACPCDGKISQLGTLKNNQLFQAKNFYYDLSSLLADDQNLVEQFMNGSFATLYLAPHNYHRVHMPLDGELQQTIFVPGSLFSVNNTTADYVPNLFARNERLISIFSTSAGPMAVILIGALIVGSIKMVWNDVAIRHDQITSKAYGRGAIKLVKGEELGLFKLGSTVVLLFGHEKVEWSNKLHPGLETKFGESLGKIN